MWRANKNKIQSFINHSSHNNSMKTSMKCSWLSGYVFLRRLRITLRTRTVLTAHCTLLATTILYSVCVNRFCNYSNYLDAGFRWPLQHATQPEPLDWPYFVSHEIHKSNGNARQTMQFSFTSIRCFARRKQLQSHFPSSWEWTPLQIYESMLIEFATGQRSRICMEMPLNMW